MTTEEMEIILDTRICETSLSVRARNLLRQANLTTIRDLTLLSGVEFRGLRRIGRTTYAEVLGFLWAHGLTFAGDTIPDQLIKKLPQRSSTQYSLELTYALIEAAKFSGTAMEALNRIIPHIEAAIVGSYTVPVKSEGGGA